MTESQTSAGTALEVFENVKRMVLWTALEILSKWQDVISLLKLRMESWEKEK